jgi:hypothetical protein
LPARFNEHNKWIWSVSAGLSILGLKMLTSQMHESSLQQTLDLWLLPLHLRLYYLRRYIGTFLWDHSWIMYTSLIILIVIIIAIAQNGCLRVQK